MALGEGGGDGADLEKTSASKWMIFYRLKKKSSFRKFKGKGKKSLSILPTTFPFVVSHPTHHPIAPPEKGKDTNRTALFCVLRKWFGEAVFGQ